MVILTAAKPFDVAGYGLVSYPLTQPFNLLSDAAAVVNHFHEHSLLLNKDLEAL